MSVFKKSLSNFKEKIAILDFIQKYLVDSHGFVLKNNFLLAYFFK